MIFTVGTEHVHAFSAYFEKIYDNSGLGVGELRLDEVKSVIDKHSDKLQVSDIVTEYERDLSRVGFALFEGKNLGVETVNVRK